MGVKGFPPRRLFPLLERRSPPRIREEVPVGTVPDPVTTLEPVVRRVVAARVRDRGGADEIWQETLARVWERGDRLDDDALLPYAVTVARNLVISRARTDERRARREH